MKFKICFHFQKVYLHLLGKNFFLNVQAEVIYNWPFLMLDQAEIMSKFREGDYYECHHFNLVTTTKKRLNHDNLQKNWKKKIYTLSLFIFFNIFLLWWFLSEKTKRILINSWKVFMPYFITCNIFLIYFGAKSIQEKWIFLNSKNFNVDGKKMMK